MSFRAAARFTLRRSALPTLSQHHPLSALRQFHTTLPKMTVHNIESKVAFDEAVKTHSVVIVDAFATWCGPCKAIAPIVAKISDEEQFKDFFFVKIDVDDLPELSQELGITAMPTFVAFKNGELSGKVVGAKPDAIKKLVADLL
ncbi:thioredoxin-like protein [Hypoxylon argillaceum]|nr:thioredoxin-like protein [Hypoxylon argillaceum]